MPIVFIFAGALLIAAAIRGTYGTLGTLLYNDFTGAGPSGTGGGFTHSFLVWLAAIAAIGFLGYVPALRTPSRLLLGLVLFGILVSNKGFFSQFTQALQTQPAAVPATTTPVETQPLPAAIPVQVSGAGGGGGPLGQVGQGLGILKTGIGLFGG